MAFFALPHMDPIRLPSSVHYPFGHACTDLCGKFFSLSPCPRAWWGFIGTTSQPVSGMTISALLAVSFILYLMGVRGDQGMVLTLVAGAVICIAICNSGDISQDLKTGALLGATPSRQQAAEIVGVLATALVAGFIIFLFQKTGDLQKLPTPPGPPHGRHCAPLS